MSVWQCTCHLSAANLYATPPTPSHAGEVELEADKTMAELKVENDRVLYMTSSQ